MKKILLTLFLLIFLLAGNRPVRAEDTFEVLVKATTPQSNYSLHVTGKFPGQMGWIKTPWVRLGDYFSLANTKFKSLRIYLKRVELTPNNYNLEPVDFLTQRIKPFLKKTQNRSGGLNYEPQFKIIYEKPAKVGVKNLDGHQAEYHYDNPQKQMLAVKYYVVKQGKFIHLVTYTGRLEEFNALKETFEVFVTALDFKS